MITKTLGTHCIISLKSMGIKLKAIQAKNGDDCLKVLGEQAVKPDLILLDIMMPGTPVSQIVKKIKDVKIAFLSAICISKTEKEGFLADEKIVDFIEKPINHDDLLAFIREQVGE